MTIANDPTSTTRTPCFTTLKTAAEATAANTNMTLVRGQEGTGQGLFAGLSRAGSTGTTLLSRPLTRTPADAANLTGRPAFQAAHSMASLRSSPAASTNAHTGHLAAAVLARVAMAHVN